MWRAYISSALAAAVMATGCTSSPSSLETARATFEAKVATSYSFHSGRVCPPPEDLCREMSVAVVDGEITAVTYVDDSSGVPVGFWPDTIPGLFDRIADAIDRDAAEVTVTYDAELGYPRSVFIDYEVTTAHDELALRLSGVEPLPLSD